jgi:hypothetical protein
MRTGLHHVEHAARLLEAEAARLRARWSLEPEWHQKIRNEQEAARLERIRQKIAPAPRREQAHPAPFGVCHRPLLSEETESRERHQSDPRAFLPLANLPLRPPTLSGDAVWPCQTGKYPMAFWSTGRAAANSRPAQTQDDLQAACASDPTTVPSPGQERPRPSRYHPEKPPPDRGQGCCGCPAQRPERPSRQRPARQTALGVEPTTDTPSVLRSLALAVRPRSLRVRRGLLRPWATALIFRDGPANFRDGLPIYRDGG